MKKTISFFLLKLCKVLVPIRVFFGKGLPWFLTKKCFFLIKVFFFNKDLPLFLTKKIFRKNIFFVKNDGKSLPKGKPLIEKKPPLIGSKTLLDIFYGTI